MKKKKTTYLPPAVEVIEVENEAGIMVGSSKLPGYEGSESAFSVNRSSARTSASPHSTSTLSDLEDLINDILTIQK